MADDDVDDLDADDHVDSSMIVPPSSESEDVEADDDDHVLESDRNGLQLAGGRGLEARTIAAAGLLLLSLDSESDDDELLTVALMAACASSDDGPTVATNTCFEQKDGRVRHRFRVNYDTLPSEFEKCFCVTLSTFEHLACKTASSLQSGSAGTGFGFHRFEAIPVHKQLMIALWSMANQDSFQEVADRFKVCRRTAWLVLHKFVSVLIQVNEDERIICWPSSSSSSSQQSQTTSRSFAETYCVTDVIGCLDSRHVAIKEPTDEPEVYVNDRGFHSLQVQYVCDDRLSFMDVYVGDLGSVSCRTVLRRSPLFRRLDEDDRSTFPSPKARILASVTYGGVHDRIRTPDELENVIESARHVECCRRTTDRTFRMLMARCGRLEYLDMSRLDLLVGFVAACCILHNLCISLGDGAVTLDDDDDHASEMALSPFTDRSD